MKTNHDRTFLIRLSRHLTTLLALLQKKKPDTAYSKAEIRAFSEFSRKELFMGILYCVRGLHTQLYAIPFLIGAKPADIIFYIQNQIAWADRLFILIDNLEPELLQVISKKLKKYDIENVNRNRLPSSKNIGFEKLIQQFLEHGNIITEHTFLENLKLIELYIPLFRYYYSHRKQLGNTKEEYIFLAISEYILNARNLEIIFLLNAKR